MQRVLNNELLINKNQTVNTKKEMKKLIVAVVMVLCLKLKKLMLN